jgi:hypothetical protein
MNSPSWLEIADVLAAVARALRLEWRCELPPFDTLPSAALDEECDAWCLALAANLGEPLQPPERVRPWILARLVSMSASAKSLPRGGAVPPPAMAPSEI